MINHILAASRVPWVLEQKGIKVEGNLMHVNINQYDGVNAQLYKMKDIMKFEGWKFRSHLNPSNGVVGELFIELDGVKYLSVVREDELPLLNLD